jgi:hypothetical protein
MDAVEIWEPYIKQYGLKNKYGWVYEENVLKMPLDVLGAYDFYILGDILEHLSVEDAQWLMNFLKIKRFMKLKDVGLILLKNNENI